MPTLLLKKAEIVRQNVKKVAVASLLRIGIVLDRQDPRKQGEGHITLSPIFGKANFFFLSPELYGFL